MPLMLPSLTKPGFRDAALFRPDSVVLVADPMRPETAVLARNLAAGGFHGRLYAVGVAAEGFIPAASVEALPETPHLAVLCLPPEWLEATMKALAARGCHAAIVPGPAPDLAQMARRTGVRALGQDSFGLCVPSIGLNASMAHLAPKPGKLALVTQSAALARTVLDWAAAEGLGFSHVIGIGGNTDIGFAMALDWLARDAGTGAVLLDIRRIKNRRLFISAARATARTRPVVAIRAGSRSADGTGLGDKVMAAALRRAGWVTFMEPCDVNHVLPVAGRSYGEYLAARPGPVRTTLKRKANKVQVSIETSFNPVSWAAYEAIYAQSWSEEGCPGFLRAFAEQEGAAGRLRLAIARADGRPVAAQFWTVEAGTAFIHKLAHIEDARALSPGTTLTAALLERVIDGDRVELVDFGTGNDAYKRNWMEQVRPRFRIEAFRAKWPVTWPAIARKVLHRVAAGGSDG